METQHRRIISLNDSIQRCSIYSKFRTAHTAKMQTPNFYLFHILLTFDKQKIAFFWQTIHFCSMKWKVFIVIWLFLLSISFSLSNGTIHMTIHKHKHTRKKCAHVLIQFVLLFSLLCIVYIYIWIVSYSYERCFCNRAKNIQFRILVRGVACVCVFKDEQSQMYIFVIVPMSLQKIILFVM